VCRRTEPQGISFPRLIFSLLLICLACFVLQYFINFNEATVVFTAYVLATLITFTVKESNASFMSDIDPQKIVLIGLYVFTFSHISSRRVGMPCHNFFPSLSLITHYKLELTVLSSCFLLQSWSILHLHDHATDIAYRPDSDSTNDGGEHEDSQHEGARRSCARGRL
jgi:hypothetical protein